MERKLDLPFPANVSSLEALSLLSPYEIGEIYDYSAITTSNASGHAVLTDLGLALASPADGHVLGLTWDELPAFPRRLIGRDQTILVTLPLDDDTELEARINGGFYLNLRAAQSQVEREAVQPMAPIFPIRPPLDPRELTPLVASTFAPQSSSSVTYPRISRPPIHQPEPRRRAARPLLIAAGLVAGGVMFTGGAVALLQPGANETAAIDVNQIVEVQGATTLAMTTTVVPAANEPEAKQLPLCDPNYSGCVPIADDVDCDATKEDGPAYIDGQVDVIGLDIYELDDDGDGVACEK